MIFWSTRLHWGESAGTDRRRILARIRRHELQLGVYVITLAANGVDILDIIPACMLSADGYMGHDIRILGIALGKDESRRLAAAMIMEAVKQNGSSDIRGYFV